MDEQVHFTNSAKCGVQFIKNENLGQFSQMFPYFK